MSITTSVPYPQEGQKITFLDPFPRTEYNWDHKRCLYIRVSISCRKVLYKDMMIRIKKVQQLEVLDWLLLVDKKLTQSVVKCMPDKTFMLISRNPQTDFFDKVKQASLGRGG